MMQQAVWANWKYYSDHTLPLDFVAEMQQSISVT